MLRILKSRFKEITERGNEFIKKWIVKCVKEDGFVLILVFGDKGLGKSTLGLNIVYNSLKELYPDYDDNILWNQTVKHTVFTIEDFDNAPNRADIWKWEDGRVPILLWDDFAMHTSSYGFLRGEGDKIGSFLEDFEAVREDVAVLVITCATPEMMPPKMRESPQIYVKIVRRGKGKIYVKEDDKDGRTLFDKILVWRYTITSDKVPDEFYSKYRELKKKAHEIKKKQRLLRKKEKAEELAEKIKDWEWSDKLILSSYGIIDTFDNITGFGELIIRAYIEMFGRVPPLPDGINISIISIDVDEMCKASNENVSKVEKIVKLFDKLITVNDLTSVLRRHGKSGNTQMMCSIKSDLMNIIRNKLNNGKKHLLEEVMN